MAEDTTRYEEGAAPAAPSAVWEGCGRALCKLDKRCTAVVSACDVTGERTPYGVARKEYDRQVIERDLDDWNEAELD